MFTQRMRRLQGASDNLIIEMQTTDREKFLSRETSYGTEC